MSKLAEFQAKLKAPKDQKNSFGGYQYRSAEDILEAAKKIVNPEGFSIRCTDEITQIGNRIYVRATALLTDGNETYETYGFAREEEVKKGMDAAQITGSASSYARKYALSGLFAIDDTKDPDGTNDHKDTLREEEKAKIKATTTTDDIKLIVDKSPFAQEQWLKDLANTQYKQLKTK